MNTPAQILIVEDDAVLATELQETLTQLGYRVIGLAATGKAAVKSALAQKPDVILMDIRLRGAMTGIQAVEHIHQQLDIPVVYLTAHADEAYLQQAKITDAYAYLVKPVRERELRAGLEMALYKHAAEQRLQHLNHILRAVRDVNQLITREHDAQRLMDDACQILLRAHGYQFVWIGQPAGDRLKPRAHAGDGQKLIARIVASATPEQGMKLPGTEASRTRRVALCHDMLHDERYAPWREEVKQAHFSSTVAVPIFHEENLFGVLSVYSDQTNIFGAEEIDLLLEMAGDIAFGLKAIAGEAERQRAAETLRASETRYRELFDNASLAIFQSTLDGAVLAVNPEFARMFGFASPAEVTAAISNAAEIFVDRKRREEIIRLKAENPDLTTFESLYQRKDGSTFIGKLNVRQVVDPDNRLLFFEGFIEDITERKHADAELLNLKRSIDQSIGGIARADMNGNIVFANKSWAKMHGYEVNEVIGSQLSIFHTREQMEHDVIPFNKNVERYGSYAAEVGHVRKDGTTFVTWMESTVVKDNQKKPIELVGSAIDITERKQAEEALRESEEKFKTLFNTANDAIFTLNHTTFLDCNATTETIFRCSREQIIGRSPADFSPEQQPDGSFSGQSAAAKIEAAFAGQPQVFEWLHTHLDGTLFDAEVSLNRVFIGGEFILQAIVRDITEHKRAEEALRENQGFLSGLIENNGALIYVKDLDGRYELVNKKWEEVTGLERETSIGRTDEELFPGRVGKDFRQMDVKIMGYGAMREIEESLENAMGTRVFISIKFPLRDKNNAVKGLCGISTDITERKRTEVALWLSEQAARQTAKQLQMVNQISVKITAGLDFDQLMKTIHEQCQQIGDTDIFYVALYDDVTGMVSFPFNYKDGEHRPNASRNIRETPGLLGHIFASRQTLYIPDELNLSTDLTQVRQAGAPPRSLIAVPLTLNERVVGALSMQSYAPDAYMPEQIHMLELLATQVAIAIQNSQLYEQVQNELLERKCAEEETALKNKHLTMLNQLGQALNSLAPLPEILERTSNLIGQVFENQNLYIALYDDATNLVSFPIYWMAGERRNSLHSRPLSNGLTEFVIRARAPILIPENVSETMVERGIAAIGTVCQCYLGVPIMIDERVVGVIAVQDYERAQVYTANHVELLATIASQAAIAIENARLYESVQRELAERKRAEEALQQQNQFLLALQNTTLELVSQLDLKTLLENIVKRACALVGTSAGLLDLIDPVTNQLIPQIGVGALEESLHLPVQPGEGLVGIVWQTGEMLVIPDYDQWTGRLDKFSHSTLGSVIGVPLLSNEHVLGVLATGSAYGSPHHFDPVAIEMLNQFARLATVAVQNARLFANLQAELTERKRAEEALRESQALTNAIVNSTADWIWSVDPEKFGLLTFNDGLSNYFIQRREIRIQIGMRPEDLFPTDDYIKLWHELYWRALSEGSYTVEYGVYAKTNVLLLTFNLLKRDGKVFGISVFGRDITERKQAEQAIQENEARLNAVVQTANDAIITMDSRGAIVDWNTAAGTIFGYSAKEALSMPINQIAPEQFRPQQRRGIERALTTKERHIVGKTIEVTGLAKDGREFPVEMSLAEWQTQAGSFFTAIIRDISERKQAEERIKQSEKKYRELFDVNKDGIAIFFVNLNEPPSTFVETNDAAPAMLGYTREEMLKLTPLMLEPSLTPARVQSRQSEFASKGAANFETVLLHKDGHPVFTEFTAQLIQYEGKPAIMNIVRDITERKRAEEALRESEQRLKEAQRLTLIGNWELDLVNNTLIWSDEIYRIFEIDPAKFGASYDAFLDAIHPDDRKAVNTAYTSSLETRIPYEIDHRLLMPDSSEKYVHERCETFYDADGHPIRSVGTVQDITERKQRENELQAIATLSMALRTAETRTEMLPVIINQINTLLNSDAATVEIINPQTGDVTTEVANGVWANLAGSQQAKGTGINAIISRTLEPYITHDLENDPNTFYHEWARAGIRGSAGVPLIAQEKLIGFIWVGRKTGITKLEVRLLSSVADIAANAIRRATLHEQTQKDAAELALAYDTTLEGWVQALELRDHETEGHARRVVQMTVDLARAMGIDECELEHVRRGALLHDIGKMGIPDSILLKTGKLDVSEWEIMKQHPEYAYKFLKAIEYLHPALDIPYCHHERWDGSGYPRNLQGEEIPLKARIFAIVDVWDALRSDRPYRKAWKKEKALAHISQGKRKHFDPAVVDAFLKIV